MKAEVGLEKKVKKVDTGKEIAVEPGEVFATLELIVRNSDGEITEHRKLKSKSFVRQFLELLYAQACGLDAYSMYAVAEITDITDTDRPVDAHSKMFACNAAAENVNNGVVVGTDDGTITAKSVDNNKLGAQIGHGTGDGQLQYSAVVFGDPAASATTSQFRITRDFANGSGGSIDVHEIGLYVSDGTYNYMTIRDILGSAIAVPAGQTLTVNYQIQANI